MADERALVESLAYFDDEKRLIQNSKQISEELTGLLQGDTMQGSKRSASAQMPEKSVSSRN